MKIKFKKLHPDAVIPEKAHETDAGFDLYCVERSIDGDVETCKTGIAVSIPVGYVGLLFSRSSIYKYDLLQNNAVGVIDSGYLGDLTFKFRVMQPFMNCYKVGERVGQLVIMPIPSIELEEVDDLGQSERGNGGFGSSGK